LAGDLFERTQFRPRMTRIILLNVPWSEEVWGGIRLRSWWAGKKKKNVDY